MQLDNRGAFYGPDGVIKYGVRGNRMSGDMNTGMGNCLLMCHAVYRYMRASGFSQRSYSFMNNGDDCYLIMERRDLVRAQTSLEHWFVRQGFSIVSDPPCYEFNQIEFCQTRPIQTKPGPEGCRMDRGPAGLDKDLLSIRDCSTKTLFDTYRKANSDCGVCLAGDLPLGWVLYPKLGSGVGRVAKGDPFAGDYTGAHILAARMDTVVSEPTCMSRVTYAIAWGISPARQLLLEEHYRSQPAVQFLGAVAKPMRPSHPVR